MKVKKGYGWTAVYDEKIDRYFGEYGGGMNYNLYELEKDQFDLLDSEMTEGDACQIMYKGRHMYMSVNDRCGPPYTIVFDDEYKTLCPWASIVGEDQRVWPKELTDAAVELFESEKKNREYRKKKKDSNK